MGSNQSSHAKLTNDSLGVVTQQQSKSNGISERVRGRKTNPTNYNHEPTETTEYDDCDLDQSSDDNMMMSKDHDAPTAIMEVDEEGYEDDEDDTDDDDDLEEERRLIEQDMAQLILWVNFYFHPEATVQVDSVTQARCYFDRDSACVVDHDEDGEQVLADSVALKKLAVDYLHPELSVVTTDSAACGRNYFTRPSAPQVDENDEEREQVLADALTLKKLVVDYLHPELPVTTTDATACGRNFFTRPAAPEQDEVEEEQRQQVLADAKALKKHAVEYLHPELPVSTTDATACGRNYFTRPSAPEQDDRGAALVLADAIAMKKLAVDYLHPELPVVPSDPTVFGRNFFTRPSALEQDEAEEEERQQVLADAKALKMLAVDFLHPERPVATTDAAVVGRNFFTRPAAPEQDEAEEEQRQQVLADAKALKKHAVEYLHPELPVSTTDATSCGRNYFTRPSAPEQDDHEAALVLADAIAMKKLAVDYLHPELPVTTTDATACGRNFFTRPAAPEQDEAEDEERQQVLADAIAMKKLAVDYLHPEIPVVTTDAAAFGRNFFTRPSAPEQDDHVAALVLADAIAMKKLAVDYLHPELPVSTTDPTVFGRSYFTRPSATGGGVDEVEREQVLADAVALKKLAVDYLHPELPVITTDPTVFGRNYFTRSLAPAQDLPSELEDQLFCIEMAMSLKQMAVNFAHPEMPCETTDSTAMGRNYFSRPSAPGHTGFIHTSGYDNNDEHAKQNHEDFFCDESSQEHHDHFVMDEDIFNDMYSSLHLPHSEVPLKGGNHVMADGEEEEEGKLSRSPSSVMLFEQGLEQGY